MGAVEGVRGSVRPEPPPRRSPPPTQPQSYSAGVKPCWSLVSVPVPSLVSPITLGVGSSIAGLAPRTVEVVPSIGSSSHDKGGAAHSGSGGQHRSTPKGCHPCG